MPVGEQAAGGSLGTIFYPARPTARFACGKLWYLFPRFLPGRGLLTYRHRGSVAWRWLPWFGANLVAPIERSSLRLETGEITAARRTTAGTGAESQQQKRPTGRVIVLGCPFGQFLPVAAGTTRIFPRSVRPEAGFPTATAAAAADDRKAHKTLEELDQPLRLGNADLPSPAVRTSYLHG